MSVPAEPSFAQAYALTLPPEGDPRFIDHARAWVGHVQAGRIGVGAGMTDACLDRLCRMEMAVLGALSPAVRALVARRG